MTGKYQLDTVSVLYRHLPVPVLVSIVERTAASPKDLTDSSMHGIG